MDARTIGQLPDAVTFAHLAAVFESSEDAIVSITPAGVITSWSPGAARLYGYPGDEAIGRTIFFLSPPNRQHDLCDLISRIEDGDRVSRARLLRVRRDGISLPVCITAAPIRDDNGELIAISLIESDLSIGKMAEQAIAQLNQTFEARFSQHARDLEVANNELRREMDRRHEVEVALKENQIQLQTILDATHAAIYAKDLEGRYFLVNRRAAINFDLSHDEMIGKTVWDMFPPHVAEQIALHDSQVVESGQAMEFEETMTFKDAEHVVLSIRVPLRDASNTIYGVCGMTLDITQRKRDEGRIKSLNETLQQRTVELEALNREIESFSYSVSHDLRAPLRSMAGFSQALCEDYGDSIDESGRNLLHRIRAASERMGLLIDDLLDLSRVSRTPLTRVEVDLSEIVCSVLSSLREREPSRSIDLIVAREAPAVGDPRQLQIVLDNLIGNAWKFTSKTAKSRIEFGVETAEGERTFFIKDNGAGFDPEYAGKLFGAFQRLHSSKDYPGTGIGLATVQRIVHRHGGRVWADGKPDEGATFYFTLGPADQGVPNAG